MQGRDRVGDNDDESGMQRQFAEESNEIRTIVRDERIFVFDDPFANARSVRPLRPRWLTCAAAKPAAWATSVSDS